MTEITALQKHSCPACGAQAEWSPAKTALICPYCGTESPAEVDTETGKVREIDLAQTLRELPEDLRGWQAEKRTVRCRSCKATTVFDPEHVAKRCDFCGSPEIVDYDEIKAPIRPIGLLPFQVADTKVRESIRSWYASKWLAPGKLKKGALVDTVHGVYLPYWTFDAQTHCQWQAQAGYYYYETQSFTDNEGRRQTRQVQKTRWRSAAGEIEHFFDDEPIPGSRGVDLTLLRQIEPFPTGELVPYDTAFLSGFVVEHYSVVLIEAAQRAREAIEQQLRSLCGRQVPGDTHRDLRIQPTYSGETFKHILVPVWLLSYDFRGKPFQVLVNGYTGEIAGYYPKSFWKIFFLVLAAILFVALFLMSR